MWETLSKLAIAIGGQIAIMLGIAGTRGLAKRAMLANSLVHGELDHKKERITLFNISRRPKSLVIKNEISTLDKKGENFTDFAPGGCRMDVDKFVI